LSVSCRHAASNLPIFATTLLPHQPGSLSQGKERRDRPLAMPIGQALTRMRASARKFNAGTVSSSDLAWVAAAQIE